MTMIWELTAVDAATRVEIRADHVPAGISAADHAAGLRSSLANLAAFLERRHGSREEVELPPSETEKP
jgi:hypothetical protein